MNYSTVILIVVGIIVFIAVVAWLLYKANFKAKEITVKTPVFEAKMERESGSAPQTETPKPRTEATQEATDGGRIDDSKIKMPADSGAKAKQKAQGKSSISGSNIELK